MTTSEEIDRENSRPLDVHRWSDFPEVNEFVDKIWKEFLEQNFPEPTGRGKRSK